jgi:hypothetical protein
LFAAYVAEARKPADQLSVADIHRAEVQGYLRKLQEAVDHHFPETLRLQTKILNGPRFVHFAPLEEYMLPWMKLGLANSESVGGTVEKRMLDRKMVAIYPKEGTLWHNNPGGIVQNAPWTSQEKQRAARLFIDYLLRPEHQERAMEWDFRPANSAVAYGKYLGPEYGIDPTQPKVLLGRVRAEVAEEIMNAWQDVKKPGVVALVLDLSGSMASQGKLDRAKEGAKRFLDVMAPHNYMRGRGVLLTELFVANWCYPWQEGGQHGHDPHHRQDFPPMGPSDPNRFSPVSRRHPFPSCRTSWATREDLCVPGMVDHVDRGPGGQMQSTELFGHSPDDLPVLERAVRPSGAVTAYVRKPMARAVKNNRLPAGKTSRIRVAHLSSRVPRCVWSVAIR